MVWRFDFICPYQSIWKSPEITRMSVLIPAWWQLTLNRLSDVLVTQRSRRPLAFVGRKALRLSWTWIGSRCPTLGEVWFGVRGKWPHEVLPGSKDWWVEQRRSQFQSDHEWSCCGAIVQHCRGSSATWYLIIFHPYPKRKKIAPGCALWLIMIDRCWLCNMTISGFLPCSLCRKRVLLSVKTTERDGKQHFPTDSLAIVQLINWY